MLDRPEPAAIHVWSVWLTGPAALADAYEGLLSVAERDRAQAFLRRDDRVRYVIAHGALRRILGRYLGGDGAAAQLGRTPAGKPTCAGPLQFSLSHSGALALVAVSIDRPVGVDVERVHDVRDAPAIARRWFDEREAALVATAAPAAAPGVFLRLWTAKESCVKETGDGIGALPDVSVEPDARWARAGRTRWALREVPVAPGYVASLAVQGPPPDLLVRSLDHPVAARSQSIFQAAGVSA